MKRVSPRLSRPGQDDDPNHVNKKFSSSCSHLDRINLQEIMQGALYMPSEWKCSLCRKHQGQSVWACLCCKVLACHDGQEHASAHFAKSKKQHCLFLDINEKQVFCMICQEYVVDSDQSDRTVASLVEDLHKVESGRYVLENGLLIKIGDQPTPHFKSKQFEEQDKLDTAVAHFRHKLMLRAMSRWKSQAEESVKRRGPPSVIQNAPKKPPKMILEPTVSKVVAPGKTGLRNLGNTCFINSVIQSLSNLPQFRDWFINSFMDTTTPIRYNNSVTLWRRGTLDCLNAMSSNVSVDNKEISMCVELHYILRVLWSGKWTVVTPYALLDALWRFVPHFRGYVQQDAQELFSYMMDRINTELTEAMKKIPKLNAKASIGEREESSIVSQTFGGSFVNEVVCCKCSNSSLKTESFFDLEVDVLLHSVARRRNGPPESVSLDDCLQSFCKWESIPDYRCEKCAAITGARKRMMISKFPPVLCIVLKRFCVSSSGSLAKNDAGVRFPLVDLSLSHLSHTRSEVQSYHLRSVIIHHGLGLRKGHYSCMAYNSHLDEWFHYNDAKVTKVDDNTVLKTEAYMLFYSAEEM